uniref:CNNM transmembrane domain-containing protein n=1 Tax=Syphacia muris TaxID=451379 RepID=A0A0N5A8Q9_9BILA
MFSAADGNAVSPAALIISALLTSTGTFAVEFGKSKLVEATRRRGLSTKGSSLPAPIVLRIFLPPPTPTVAKLLASLRCWSVLTVLETGRFAGDGLFNC